MKILVIRFIEIGDVLLTSCLCSTLKASIADAQVDYLMYDTSAPLFDGHSAIDNVLTISKAQRKNPIRYFLRAAEIARRDYDVIIDATSTNKSELISLLARKTPIKIGREKKRRGFAYTHRIPKSQLTGNKVEQRLALLEPLKALGHTFVERINMQVHITAKERYAIREQLARQGVDMKKKMIGVCISARLSQKKWCRAQMQKTIQHCLDKDDTQVILLAGLPHEQKDAKIVHDSMDRPENLYHSFNITSLRSLAGLISYCDIFIGNEGGPRHIAEALGLPTAAVFAPCTRMSEWMPTNNAMHQGLEWQSLPHNEALPSDFEEIGDSAYFKLYNSIKAEHFTPLVDSVLSQAYSDKASAA